MLGRISSGIAAATVCIASSCAFAQQAYSIVDRWKVGGTGGWDYLLADPPQHRLYVTHGTRVEVLDTVTGHIIGSISGLKGTHGIALDSDGKTGYISDGGANAVVVFDRGTLATLASIPTGGNPDGVIFEPTTKTVWAFNGHTKNVTVIDTASRSVIATIGLPGKPEFPQVDGEGNVFVNIEDRNSIVHLSAADKKMVATWPLKGCESPSGMAFDNAGVRLFSVCDGGKMAVTDATTGKQLALPAIGDGPDAAGYDAKDGLAFSSNGDGTLSVVNTRNGYKTIQTVATVKGARTMAYDAAADRIYLSSAAYGPTPPATAAVPHPRAAVLPDTFTILVVGRK
ncbi:MAG: hypothetical protein ACRYGF_12605 [Janthinobacterium lividum]